MCAKHFGGVQAAVDPDHPLAFPGQCALFIGQAVDCREAP